MGTILHRVNSNTETLNPPEEEADLFVLHSTPSLLGVGLIEGIPEANIIANADPDDQNGDGISGRVGYLEDGRMGRWLEGPDSVAARVRARCGRGRARDDHARRRRPDLWHPHRR